MTVIYLIGSLRNPRIPQIGNDLRANGYEVFDDWYAVGPEADDRWRDYEQARGRSYTEALAGYAARNTFNFDRTHLMRADIGVLVSPAGKSAHLELGMMLGKGKKGFIFFEEEPERWDVMYQFATGVASGMGELLDMLDLATREG